MKASIHLCVADKLRLELLLNHHDHGIRVLPEQKSQIKALLARAQIDSNEIPSANRVGFHDRVTLVSLTDPADSFVLEISMPSMADLHMDRISVALPVSLAVLGRACGEKISWEIPSGSRHMQIASIIKAEQLQAV